jgi:hypothetical protein
MAFTVTDGKITQIDALVDPERLAQLNPIIPPPTRAEEVHHELERGRRAADDPGG